MLTQLMASSLTPLIRGRQKQHNGVANVLVHGSPIAEGYFRHRTEVKIEHLGHVLRIRGFSDVSKPHRSAKNTVSFFRELVRATAFEPVNID